MKKVTKREELKPGYWEEYKKNNPEKWEKGVNTLFEISSKLLEYFKKRRGDIRLIVPPRGGYPLYFSFLTKLANAVERGEIDEEDVKRMKVAMLVCSGPPDKYRPHLQKQIKSLVDGGFFNKEEVVMVDTFTTGGSLQASTREITRALKENDKGVNWNIFSVRNDVEKAIETRDLEEKIKNDLNRMVKTDVKIYHVNGPAIWEDIPGAAGIEIAIPENKEIKPFLAIYGAKLPDWAVSIKGKHGKILPDVEKIVFGRREFLKLLKNDLIKKLVIF